MTHTQHRWPEVRASLPTDMQERLNAPLLPGAHCDHDWTGGKKSQSCTNCGATCIRDEQGVIIDYDRVPGQYVEGVSGTRVN